jgi:hypothetical protein
MNRIIEKIKLPEEEKEILAAGSRSHTGNIRPYEVEVF